jgi:hypothetical protein
MRLHLSLSPEAFATKLGLRAREMLADLSPRALQAIEQAANDEKE